MYIACRQLKYDGVIYNPGDVMPVDSVKPSLISCGRVKEVSEDLSKADLLPEPVAKADPIPLSRVSQPLAQETAKKPVRKKAKKKAKKKVIKKKTRSKKV